MSDSQTMELIRIKGLEKELKEVRLERDILKKAVNIFSKSDIRYQFIQSNTSMFSVEKMCFCMRVRNNSYYTWLRVGKNKGQKPSLVLLTARVLALFNESKQIYGSYRIQKMLEREDLNYCRSYVAIIMRELGLRIVLTKKFRVCTTDFQSFLPFV